MRSMTGLGSADAPLGKGKVIASVRSVNHRYLDMRVRVPPELADASFTIERHARKRLERGRFDITVRVEGAALPPRRLDPERARALFADLVGLRDELAPEASVNLEALTGMAELILAPEPDLSGHAESAVLTALDGALQRLKEMRAREGSALKQELARRLQEMRGAATQITERGSAAAEEHRARVRDRLDRLLSERSLTVDEPRLETELAVLAERSDITEELVRLESHFEQLEELMNKDEAVGRRMDFLLQEVSREANTIGSKCQDATLSHTVVDLKAETERMREQVQNVE